MGLNICSSNLLFQRAKPDPNTTEDRNHSNPHKKFLQYEVGLVNPVVKNGPLSEEETVKAMEDYYFEPSVKTAGIVTFSEKLKKQNLGRLRINSKNMKMYFPTDKEYQAVSEQAFKEAVNQETSDFATNKQNLSIISHSEKPENHLVNPYQQIYERIITTSQDIEAKAGKRKENSQNATMNEAIQVNDQYSYSMNNKQKKNLLQLSVEQEEKIYKENLETLRDSNERLNKQQISPIMKYNMKNLQGYRMRRRDPYSISSNGIHQEFIENNNDYYKYN